jgi:protein phosphatase 1 regulatory subunit 7
LKGIENLKELEYLSCHSNKLTSLEGIENLKELEYLSCHSNNLTSLIGIENLTKLKELFTKNTVNSENIQNLLKEIKIKKRRNIINSLKL